MYPHSAFYLLHFCVGGGSRGSDAGHWTRRASVMCGKHHYFGDDALKMSIRYCFLADTFLPKAFVLCSFAVQGSTCHARPRMGFHIAECWGSHGVCCTQSETFNWHLSRVHLMKNSRKCILETNLTRFSVSALLLSVAQPLLLAALMLPVHCGF